MNQPKVSIIMNCYNCEKYLNEAIESIYAQTFTDWEIIFWDNQSTDKSAEIAKSYDDRLKYFQSQETVNIGIARNRALNQATGKYIAFLDCDDQWFSNKLEKQIPYLDSNPKIGLVYSNFIQYFETTKSEKIFSNKNLPSGNIFEQSLINYSIGLLSILVRKKAIDELDHAFDTTLIHTEDADLVYRILYHYEAAYIHEALAIYRIHSEMWTIKNDSIIGDEVLYLCEKLQKTFPDIKIRYAHALKQMEINARLRTLFYLMRIGENKSAREIISTVKMSNFKTYLLYLLTYYPKIYKVLYSIWSKFKITCSFQF